MRHALRLRGGTASNSVSAPEGECCVLPAIIIWPLHPHDAGASGVQTVMLMGVTKKYVPITSEAAMTYQMFEVLKVRPAGYFVRQLDVHTKPSCLTSSRRRVWLYHVGLASTRKTEPCLTSARPCGSCSGSLSPTSFHWKWTAVTHAGLYFASHRAVRDSVGLLQLLPGRC